jgi:hypothetical protein
MEGPGQALGHKYTTRLNGEPGSCESREKIRITRSLMVENSPVHRKGLIRLAAPHVLIFASVGKKFLPLVAHFGNSSLSVPANVGWSSQSIDPLERSLLPILRPLSAYVAALEAHLEVRARKVVQRAQNKSEGYLPNAPLDCFAVPNPV